MVGLSAHAEEWSVTLPQINVRAAPKPSPLSDALEQHTGSAQGTWKVGKSKPLAEKLAHASTRHAELVNLAEVNRVQTLRHELTALKLVDFFDERGMPRFRRLGLGLVARPQESKGPLRGSDAEATQTKSRSPAAKAMLLAGCAVEKDLELRKREYREQQATITTADRFRGQEVAVRQVDVLFGEMPDYQRHLPPGVCIADLRQEEPSRNEELKVRRNIETDNQLLLDSHASSGLDMGWLFTYTEAIMVAKVASLWTTASRGNKCPFGMDRPSYCRMLWDWGLVDQERVPYFWAVSLFDQVSQETRMVPTAEAPLASVAPIISVVSRWSLVAILDRVCREHFTNETKGRFLGSLFQIAKYRLPEHVIEDSGLQDKAFMFLAAGRPVPNVEWMFAAAVSPSQAGGQTAPFEPGIGESKGSVLPEFLPPPEVQAMQMLDENGMPHAMSTNGAPGTRSSQRNDREPWHPFSGKPPSPTDVVREEAANSLLAQFMLVEPEVLHVIAQHNEFFEHLHSCYSDDFDDMSFASLVQLCSDFHITPELVSLHRLKALYESSRVGRVQSSIAAQALEANAVTRMQQQLQGNEALVGGRRKPAGGRRTSGGSTPRHESMSMEASGSGGSGDAAAGTPRRSAPPPGGSPQHVGLWRSASPTSPTSPPSPTPSAQSSRGALTQRTAQPKAMRNANSFSLHPGGASPAPRSASADVRTMRGRSDTSPVAGAEAPARDDKEADPGRWPTALPWSGYSVAAKWFIERTAERAAEKAAAERGAAEKAAAGEQTCSENTSGAAVGGAVPAPPRRRRYLEAKPLTTLFCHGALAEVLCRAAFEYLGAYACRKQQGMSGYLRVVWLIIYLKSVFLQLREQLRRRVARHTPQLHGGVEKAAEDTPQLTALWKLISQGTRDGTGKIYRRELLKDWRESPDVPKLLGISREFLHGAGFLGMMESLFLLMDEETKFSFDDFRAWYHRQAIEAVHAPLRNALGGDVQRLFVQISLPDAQVQLAPTVFREELPLKAKHPRERPKLSDRVKKPQLTPRGKIVQRGGTKRRFARVSLSTSTPGEAEMSRPRSRSSSADSASPPEEGEAHPSPRRSKRMSLALGQLQPSEQPHAPHASPVPLEVPTSPVALKAGERCVVGGICRLCGQPAGFSAWGNPRCAGCSVVDVLPVALHPWHRLLIGFPPNVGLEPRTAEMPRQVERCPMTPPQLFSSNTLRSGERAAIAALAAAAVAAPQSPRTPHGTQRKKRISLS